MHIHILGICGTFMGGIALLAKEQGHHVTGADLNVYPPMSTQLSEQGITLHQSYSVEQFDPMPDIVIIGNALSRGNEAVEYILNRNIPYLSGPQWLREQVLSSRWVLAVAGTHGKTTTSSLLAWILESAGLSPGFLIGGVPSNFGVSARMGTSPFFVVEADEYDTAFFDKRSKFVHYQPRTLVLNNLEYDHADIFPDLAAIERQFHHLIRTVPGEGKILVNASEMSLKTVMDMGCWTETEFFSQRHKATWAQSDWLCDEPNRPGDSMVLHTPAGEKWPIKSPLFGKHNLLNMTAAVAAARHAGVPCSEAITALSTFKGVKRRLEVFAQQDGVTFYDDFAHHPTAVASTLEGLKQQTSGRVVAVIELRSNTMQMGIHDDELVSALKPADNVVLYQPPTSSTSFDSITDRLGPSAITYNSVELIVSHIIQEVRTGDVVVIMSNGGFGGLRGLLSQRLSG